jgi:hypothetical protein
MSRLSLFGRPFTVFDPSNKAHRRWYYEFVKTSSWGHCPVRFVVPEDHGDLVTMIQRSLVAHYVQSEFERPKKVAQKGKKTVDIKSKR